MKIGPFGFIFRSLLRHVSLTRHISLGHLLRSFGLAQLLRLVGALLGVYLRSQWLSRSLLGTERAFRRMYGHILAQGLPAAYAPAASAWARRGQRRFSFLGQLALAVSVLLVGWFYLPPRAPAPAATLSLQSLPPQSVQPVSSPAQAAESSPAIPGVEQRAPAALPPLPTAAVLQTIPAVEPAPPASPAAGPQESSDSAVAVAALVERVAQLAEQTQPKTPPQPPVARVLDLRPAAQQNPPAATAADLSQAVADAAAAVAEAAPAEASEAPEPAEAAAPVPVEPASEESAPLVLALSSEPVAADTGLTVARTPLPAPVADSAPAAAPVPALSFSSRPPLAGMSLIREEIEEARTSQSFEVDRIPSPASPTASQANAAPVAASGGLLAPGGLWPAFTPPAPAEGDHYWLGLSFPSGSNQLYSPGYQFGSTAGGRYRIHHGVDTPNPAGTPVLAGAAGEVIHAGPDNPTLLGPYNNFYGNSVVIRLDQPLITPEGERDVYILYGHLLNVTVERGQRVQAGDFVGGVGMTGIAIGPHLHLEVRVGQNSYQHTLNPALWMRPLPNTGTVAVRLLSADGRTWPGARLGLLRYDANGGRWVRTIETYPQQENIGPDPVWGENGALSNIPAGEYYIVGRINGEKVGQNISVRSGETTFVELRTQQ